MLARCTGRAGGGWRQLQVYEGDFEVDQGGDGAGALLQAWWRREDPGRRSRTVMCLGVGDDGTAIWEGAWSSRWLAG
jgi:hypothetical protein